MANSESGSSWPPKSCSSRALFTTYIILRLGAPEWPHGWEALNVPLATVNTLVLITSSVTMVLAYAAAVERDLGKFRRYMGITIVLGLAFLVVKSIEYRAHFMAHEFPSTSIFTAIYFTMTGLHGLHVVIGACLMGWLAIRAKRGDFSDKYYTPVDLVALFWHLVDVIWIYLFPLYYLIK